GRGGGRAGRVLTGRSLRSGVGSMFWELTGSESASMLGVADPPTGLEEPVQFGQATGARATFDPRTDTEAINTQVSNIGNQAIKLVGFTTANLTFSQSNGLSTELAAVEPRQTVPLRVTSQSK